jgi:hypothetical protein
VVQNTKPEVPGSNPCSEQGFCDEQLQLLIIVIVYHKNPSRMINMNVNGEEDNDLRKDGLIMFDRIMRKL